MSLPPPSLGPSQQFSGAHKVSSGKQGNLQWKGVGSGPLTRSHGLAGVMVYLAQLGGSKPYNPVLTKLTFTKWTRGLKRLPQNTSIEDNSKNTGKSHQQENGRAEPLPLLVKSFSHHKTRWNHPSQESHSKSTEACSMTKTIWNVSLYPLLTLLDLTLKHLNLWFNSSSYPVEVCSLRGFIMQIIYQ